MLTVIRYTLSEAFHRRMVVVMLLAAAVFFAATLVIYRFELEAVSASRQGKAFPQHVATAAVFYARDTLNAILMTAAGLWVMLGFFTVAPLLCTYMEKGMAELLFTKGVARWQVFTGRIVGVTAVYGLTLVALLTGPGIYFCGKGHVPPGHLLASLGLLYLSFFSIVLVMALLSTLQNTPAILISAAFLQLTLSVALAQREQFLKSFDSPLLTRLLGLTYHITPKNSDLTNMASQIFDGVPVASWWPLVSTLVISAVLYAAALAILNRKSL